jgi:hypothetical protein
MNYALLTNEENGGASYFPVQKYFFKLWRLR